MSKGKPVEGNGRLLHEYACWCAKETLKRGSVKKGTDSDIYRWAIEEKERWMDGKISDEELHDAFETVRMTSEDKSRMVTDEEQEEQILLVGYCVMSALLTHPTGSAEETTKYSLMLAGEKDEAYILRQQLGYIFLLFDPHYF